MASKKTPTLSILIPTFNEENTILLLLKKISKTQLPGVRKEIIIVDDGSTDRTALLVSKTKIPNSQFLKHPANLGKGAAIRTAASHATGDFLLIQDADMEYDPTDYQRLLKPLLENKTDVVYGSRFLGASNSFAIFHYLGNKLLTFLTNLLFHSTLTDIETGYKIFKTSVFKQIALASNGFNFDPEITAQVLKKKFRILEVPISYQARDFKNGKKITWLDGFSAIFCLLFQRFSK